MGNKETLEQVDELVYDNYILKNNLNRKLNL